MVDVQEDMVPSLSNDIFPAAKGEVEGNRWEMIRECPAPDVLEGERGEKKSEQCDPSKRKGPFPG